VYGGVASRRVRLTGVSCIGAPRRENRRRKNVGEQKADKKNGAGVGSFQRTRVIFGEEFKKKTSHGERGDTKN